VQWRGERWLPAPVRALVERALRLAAAESGLVVGAPAPPRRAVAAPPETLVLEPGGLLGWDRPLSGDPATLASFLAGAAGPRSALRRVVAALSPRRSLIVAGDPLGDPATDLEQGVDLLTHEDRAAGWAQVWRLAAGQVLGVAAVLRPAAVEDVEALWLADPEPALVRRRFPLV
jgi:hypothetical protein